MADMANRPKDCIICGGPAGSREHIFPSALGGRREDKKIYCSDHNQWLGPHVAVLQEQLKAINAMLEVQPDRGTPKSHEFRDDDGQVYALQGSDVTPVADLDAIIDAHTLGQPHQVKIAPADLPRLKARAKQRGLQLEIVGTPTLTQEFRLGPYKVPLMQGGDDAMRAVAYLALTFVAHFWPHVARAPGLAAVKDMLRSGPIYAGTDLIAQPVPASGFVSWSPILDSPAEMVHPTGLGHTIVICVRGGKVSSYVALLDLQSWMMQLGDAAPDTPDATVVVHVDPFKLHYGDDWTIHRFDHALIDGHVDPGYLEQAVLGSDQMQRQVSAVIRRVIEHRDQIEAEGASEEFDAANRLPSPAREAAIRDFVARRRQTLVNHIAMFADHGSAATPLGAWVRGGALKAVQSDPASSDGMNDAARRVVEHVVDEISKSLFKAQPGFVLDPEKYLWLFGDLAQASISTALAEEYHR